MSCLTRKLQQHLIQYIRYHAQDTQTVAPEALRSKLVNDGLCPSDVTVDQMHTLMKVASEH